MVDTFFFFFFKAEDGIRDGTVTGVQTCALPISLFALAASALDEIEMVNVATPVLEELSRETSESGHFAVRMGDAVVVIARTSGPGAFQLTDRVGVVRPAHCTALGKLILASLRPDQLNRFLARVELKPSTSKSITDIAVLMREITEIK